MTMMTTKFVGEFVATTMITMKFVVECVKFPSYSSPFSGIQIWSNEVFLGIGQPENMRTFDPF